MKETRRVVYMRGVFVCPKCRQSYVQEKWIEEFRIRCNKCGRRNRSPVSATVLLGKFSGDPVPNPRFENATSSCQAAHGLAQPMSGLFSSPVRGAS